MIYTEDIKRVKEEDQWGGPIQNWDGIEDTVAGKAMRPLSNLLQMRERPTLRESVGGGLAFVTILGIIVLVWFAAGQR